MNKDLIDFEANFSVLDRYGSYVTKEEFVTDPAIGRDQQIKELILILLTPEKSAILIGKPGIGKTAIVEGLAYRIQKNDVPEALKGYEIINIKTASLLGTMPSGESKVQKMIDELKTKEKLILFIDEVHMLIGATDSSSLDFANIFKEGLGRGSIKVIGATTTEEYERYILRDKAFTRRFQRIDVPEPSRDETIKIMMGTLPKFEKQTGRKMKYTPFIQERIMSFLVDITSEYKRIFAIGSRYPDVCLTLLKQAFSYTVYDNRPYMDIFDVRKAIENSKNIYPDVIKKELPNFDKMFNDIILEEKGEKPVEEWRKESAPTRKELEQNAEEEENDSKENNIISSNNSNIKKSNRSKGNILTDDRENISILENRPEMIDREELKENKPLQNILTSSGKKKFAKVGSTAVSKGLKEKINRSENTDLLDDMLLSSDMGIIKQEKNNGPAMPTNFVVTDEIKPGVNDSFLLGRPISSMSSTIPEEKQEQVMRYKSDNSRRNKNEGIPMFDNNGNGRPERFDISNQNFDKYNNFFHQNDSNYPNNNQPNNYYGQENKTDIFGTSFDKNEELENAKRMDMLMGTSNSDKIMNNQPNQQGPMGMPQGNQMMGGMPPQGNMPPFRQNNGMPPMNGPMGMPQGNQMMGGMPPRNGNMPPFGQNNGMPPMNGPMGMPQGNQMMGGMPPRNGNMPPFGQNNGMPPMSGPMGMPQGNQMMGGMPPRNGNMPPFGQNNANNLPNLPNGKFFDGGKDNDGGESLFGAPMYSSDSNNDKLDNIPDIYTTDDLNRNGYRSQVPLDNNSLFNVPMSNNRQPEYKGESLFGAPMYSQASPQYDNTNDNSVDIFGQLITDNMRIKNGKIVDEFPTFDKLNNLSTIKSVINDVRDNSPQNNNSNQNSGGMYINTSMNQGNQSMMNPNQMYPSNNQNKNWTFIDGSDNQQMQGMQQNQTAFQSNILDAVKHKEESTSLNSSTPSTDNINSNDNSSSETFKIEDSSAQPKYDLNLENNVSEDTGFDDFYE